MQRAPGVGTARPHTTKEGLAEFNGSAVQRLFDGSLHSTLDQTGPALRLDPVPEKPHPAAVTSAIIVAAGKGARMGPNTDKLFLQLAGKPVVAYAWQRFDASPCIDEIVLVIRDGMQPAFHKLAGAFGPRKPFQLVLGGSERQDSVWNGLESVSAEADLVVIQDAARPCTSEALIEATINAARETGAAVAAQPVTDTIKESQDGKWIQRTLDRSRLWSVQTPQAFHVDVIRRALLEVRRRRLFVTDDTAACELIGQQVSLVPSAAPNPKVTRPEDLPYIEMVLKS